MTGRARRAGLAGTLIATAIIAGCAAPLSAAPTPGLTGTAPASPAPTLTPVAFASAGQEPRLPEQVSASDCQAYGFSIRRCLAVVESAREQSRLAWTAILRVHLEPEDRGGASYLTAFVANVRFELTDGSSTTAMIRCSVGGKFTLVCTERPEIRVKTPHAGYWDVPCTGEAPEGCATPLPTIDPAAAKEAVALLIPARDYPIGSVGPVELDVGRATLPNGILSEATFRLADPTTQMFTVADAVRLEIRPLDPSRPPFGGKYERGWTAGVEEVAVYLTFTITSMEPGAALEVRDLVVR